MNIGLLAYLTSFAKVLNKPTPTTPCLVCGDPVDPENLYYVGAFCSQACWWSYGQTWCHTCGRPIPEIVSVEIDGYDFCNGECAHAWLADIPF
jgi:endogenous inhibitor of DNA gyrase (YacG/DUF329 family)